VPLSDIRALTLDLRFDIFRYGANAIGEREERDFKLVAALRNEPEGATLDEMRKKYGL
jgi:hypothetical protein